MYNNGNAGYHNDMNVGLAEKEQADTIKSNLDKILHYERYRGENKNDAVSVPEKQTEDRNVYSSASATAERPRIARPEEETNADLRPSSTTMQFGRDEESDIYEEVDYTKENHKEEFRLSSKGKVLIAIYSLVVAIILSLIIINSRMLKSLDSSISSYKQKADEINAEVSRIEAEIADITSEEAIGEWALKHGMTYHGDAA